MKPRPFSASPPLAALAPVALAAALSGCMMIDNAPINAPIESELANTTTDVVSPEAGDMLVGVTFSGGGTRAAAFSFGVLQGFADSNIELGGGKTANLLDRVDFVSGVSGGSVMAAYYGLKGRAALADFRERFLIRNAEESMYSSAASPVALMRALSGGANDRSNLPQWLDKNLFEGATYAQILARKRPTIWLNASDIINHSPFVFEPNTFRAFCSDLSKLPVSEAVAASAAVPVVFAPVTLQTYPENCRYEFPPWVRFADEQAGAPALLKSYARALKSYRDPSKVKYLRLLDGGLTDNFGLSGVTIARAAAETPYAPLSPRQAVRLKQALFLVVNAGQGSNKDWALSPDTPGFSAVLSAVVDTGIDASVRQGYDAFQMTMNRWQQDIVEWRCKLSSAEVMKWRGTMAGWNCRDVKFHVGQVAFDQLPDKRERLEKIATRFVLPTEEVDLLIEAGREVIRANPVVNGFLHGLRPGGARPALAGAQTLKKE
ncbi:MAG: patatin-like phospholipase family protein [Rhizobiales bacterium]|nr:patatin-like phospholipase family protein [Hyphomicrobiales bacterium]